MSDERVNLLLVDDRPENLLALEAILEPLGQSLIRATSGPEALKHVLATEEEVILNSNSLEGRNDQYISMVLEKTLVDRCAQAPDFFQHFPSSELTSTPLTPGLGPTYSHGEITSGHLRRPRAAKKTQAA